MKRRAGIRSLALGFPSIRRTNAYWQQRYPDLVERAEHFGLARIWLREEHDNDSIFDLTMEPYRRDPFLGSVERRYRAKGESALSMELTAATGALAAAGLHPSDIDFTLVSSFTGDRLGVGNAAYLAAELELAGPAINVESACSGSLAGLALATELLQSGERQRVLVVVSTSNSLQVKDDDSVGWFVGDGAGAFVVEAAPADFGVLGMHIVSSVKTNDMFVIYSVPDGEYATRLETLGNPRTGAIARNTAEPYLREVVDAALAKAKLSLSDIDFCVFNTPTAWYADFCAQTLGVPRDRYHSVYPRYANIGAALMPATLYHAIQEGKVSPGDHVLLYSVGSTSTVAAIVIRVGDIALGPYPTPPAVPDADLRMPEAPSIATVTPTPPVPHSGARLHGGCATSAELRSLLPLVWASPADVPPSVARALEHRDPEMDASVFAFDHLIDVGEGRRVFVKERFSTRSLLQSPRRGVLLLPGPISRESLFEVDLDGYRLQTELAAAGFFVFTLEYTGTGRSSCPEDGFSVTHDVLVRDARAVIAAVRELRMLPPLDLIGESNGGAIAADLAADDHSVRSCVLSSMLYREGTPTFRHVFGAPAFVSYLRSRPNGYLKVQADYYGNILAHSPPVVAKELLRTQPGRYAIAPLLEPLRLPWYDPTQARVPAVLIQGSEDNVAVRSDVHTLAREYGAAGGGKARVVVLEGAHHIPRLESPSVAERWKAAVLEHLLA
jgi:3-oxoacyl-[acyl-carrier-protein] synthase-3